MAIHNDALKMMEQCMSPEAVKNAQKAAVKILRGMNHRENRREKMNIKAWIDSNANIHSKKTINLEFDDEDWDTMTDEEKDEAVRECVFEYLDWGYEEA